MPKLKGKLRKFIRGLGSGGSEPAQPLSRDVGIAIPSHGVADEVSSIDNDPPKDENNDALVNGAWRVIGNSTEAVECDSPPPSCEVKVLDEHDMSRQIWIEAYAGLQNGDATKELVQVYETILSQQLMEGDEHSSIPPTNLFFRFGDDVEQKIPQMRLVTENVLSDASGRSAIADGLTKAAGLVSELNGLVSPMIQSNSVAALAWGGICAALPLLLKPITAESDMAAGLWYVMGRMQWYMCLVRGLHDSIDQDRKAEQLYSQFKNRILDLYTEILTYQMQSVCYCYHDHTIMKALRAVLTLDDWKGRLESIRQLETMVQKDMNSYAAVETLTSLAEIAQSTKKLDAISSALVKIVTLQEQTRQEQEQRHLEAERTIRSELVGRFRTVDYERQMKLNPTRVPGTCEWFCTHEKFKEWLSCKGSGLLLASADPGCGKSTLARYLVEEVLPESTDSTILYFFFKDTPEQRLLTNALCAVLHQLFYQNVHVVENLKHQIKQLMPHSLSDISALWALFTQACQEKELGEVICVFDALDECEQEGVYILAKSLDQLLENAGLNGSKIQTSIKFLVTTRGYPSILEQFSDADPAMVYLSGDDKTEKDQIQSEISIVLDYQLERLSQKKHFKAERKERIHEALKAKGSQQRTYLWLTLVFQLLESTFKTTTRDWEKLIAKPPTTVNKAYETLLSRVDEDEKEAVRVLLHLIIAARRPLTLCEMNIALNVRDQSDALDEEGLGLSTDEEFKQWLIHTCGFFVTVYDERVYFIHQTAKEFLLRPDSEEGGSNDDWGRSITTRSADAMMAESCIAYLSLRQFSQRAFEDQASDFQKAAVPTSEVDPMPKYRSAMDTLFTNYKLVDYALKFWTRHFRECQYLHESAVVDINDTFFDKYLALFAAKSSSPPPWFSHMLYQYGNLKSREYGHERFRDEIIQTYSLGKAAAYCNHFRLLQYAIYQSALEPRETGHGTGSATNGIPLLHLAIFEDCSTVFLDFLARHVNIDARDDISEQTALSMASSKGYWPVVDTLLNHAADPKLADSYGNSPLSHAVRNFMRAGPPERGELLTVMDRLFSHGADVNSTNVPTNVASTTWDEKLSPLEIAAIALHTDTIMSGNLGDLRSKLEAVVTSRSGDLDPHLSSLTQILLCPDLDVFSEPSFLEAFDNSFIQYLVNHGATGFNMPSQVWGFEWFIAMDGPDDSVPGYYRDGYAWGIAFLLHAGASPRKLGLRDENEDSDASRTEISRLIDDIPAFGGRPATWMLLMKLLGHDPLSLAVRDAFSTEEHRNILQEAVKWPSPFADWAWLLLKHGQEIEGRDKDGHTPLHSACIWGRLHTVSFLLQQGADVDARNDEMQTPLHLARNAQVVQIVCDHGADLNARDHKGHAPLNTMYETGSLEAIKILLKRNANAAARDIEGMTPLHLGCNYSGWNVSYSYDGSDAYEGPDSWDKSNAERAKLLLAERQADIDARDARDRTPLHLACEQDSPELIEALLASKANPEARDAQGRTPLHLVNGYQFEHAQMVKLLLAQVVDIEARDLDGQTPLHKSVRRGQKKVAKLLLAHGANLEAADSMGNTPLHLCNYHTIDILLESGANTEARNSSGNTPVHMACSQPNSDIYVQRLLPYQPCLEARDCSGRTPLHLACQNRQDETVKLLLNHQANVDARDSLGRTPLHQACQVIYPYTVKVLLEHRADIDAKDFAGQTPMELVQKLLENCETIEPDSYEGEQLRTIHDFMSQFGGHVKTVGEQSLQYMEELLDGKE